MVRIKFGTPTKMENQKIRVELSRLCRTCCAECSHMSPLFTRNSDVSRGLNDMLMSCTNLMILETDDFPNLICNQCVDQLKSAYRFQQRCETADRYYKRLRLKSNSDCIQTPMVFTKDPNYDYIEMLENNLIVFRCRECCQAFSTIRELKNHKQIHSKNEITEEKHESLSVTQPVDFTEKENKEEHLLEMNQEEEIDEGGDEDSNSSFFKKFDNRDTKENSGMDTIPMESEIKEELSTFIDTIIKDEIEDNGRGEYKVSNICFEQPYQKDIKQLEVVAIQKEIEKESLLEVLKETDARADNNVESSSSDNRDEDYYYPSSDSDSDYFPDQPHRINIRTKNQKHLNTRRQHRLVKKLNSPKTDRPEIFQCTDCGQKFDDHKALQDHCLLHSCRVYVQRLTCFNYPKGHLHSHDNEQRLIKCGIRYHEEVHNPNIRFECDVCEKSFTHSRNLRRHQLTHNTSKPFKCDVCEKSFSCSRNLQQHKLMHNPNKRFKCDECEKLFTYSSHLSRHKMSHNASEPVKCDVCKKSFPSNSHLRTHKWTHNPNKRFKCDVCEKPFTYRSNLSSHKLTHKAVKRTHNPNTRFKCDICKKLFTHSRSLRSHQLTHNACKLFKCDVCDKTYASTSILNRHKLTHNPNKPFKCDMCEKSFSCSTYLRQHKWTHNPNKRFKCDVCEKPFTYSSNLRAHKLTHIANLSNVTSASSRSQATALFDSMSGREVTS